MNILMEDVVFYFAHLPINKWSVWAWVAYWCLHLLRIEWLTMSLLFLLLLLFFFFLEIKVYILSLQFFFSSPLACDFSDLPVVYNEDDELDEANELRK